ncbi:hypothetical protein QJS10_CPA07g00147 [Acorus calamus]|uniref:Uncharacterized protein n=1 Tax=Acorus calamus TaxID=4465 RepID=A0AAV9EI23_ACOCL|nr:hypothetical protein QJS10_CPA07g00147 [Acorus calamus]
MNSDVLESSDTSKQKWHIVPPRRRQRQQRYQQQRESAEETPSPTHSTSKIMDKSIQLRKLGVCQNVSGMPTNNVPTDRGKTPMSRIQSPKGNDLMPKKDMQLQSIPGGKMFSSPIVQPIVRAKQTSVNLEAKKDKQPLPLPPTDQLSKALVVVEQAVDRASKKRMLESSTVDTTRSLIAAHKQKELENTSHAIKLFRRSWGLDEVPSSETVMECENTNPSSSPEGIYANPNPQTRKYMWTETQEVMKEGLPTLAGRKPFRFERMWFQYPQLYQIVQNRWRNEDHASPMGRLHAKLVSLQGPLRRWNRLIVGDITRQVELANERVQQLLVEEQQDNTSHDYSESISEAVNHLTHLQRNLEIFGLKGPE